MKKCGQILLHPHIGLLCVILCSVILSNAKDLLRADKRQPALTAHSQRGDASTSLSMTEHDIPRLMCCHSERSEESLGEY